MDMRKICFQQKYGKVKSVFSIEGGEESYLCWGWIADVQACR